MNEGTMVYRRQRLLRLQGNKKSSKKRFDEASLGEKAPYMKHSRGRLETERCYIELTRKRQKKTNNEEEKL